MQAMHSRQHIPRGIDPISLVRASYESIQTKSSKLAREEKGGGGVAGDISTVMGVRIPPLRFILIFDLKTAESF
jgi:hypothetical protein